MTLDGAEARIDAARAFLTDYSAPRERDDPALAGLRHHARLMLKRPTALLFHDELGACFAPQTLSAVVAAAGDHGLAFLTDGGPNRGFDGFIGADAGTVADPDAHVVAAAQMRDYAELCWFRITLLVRAETKPARSIDAIRTAGLWVSTRLEPRGGRDFALRDDVITISDDELADALRRLAAIAPGRCRFEDVAGTPEQAAALLRLYQGWYVQLHTGPAPFAIEPGSHPRANRWLRDLLGRGATDLANLAYRHTRIDQPEIRALLIAADGSRSAEELAGMDFGIPAGQVPNVLAAAARQALLEA